ARDDPETIGARVGQGLQYDLLLLTGGVSAGNKDFVPQALASNGVEKVFHKVEFKPGKPVWFGRHERGLVFGLPGNPVAVLVCFHLFVATAIRARQGLDASLQWTPARLEADFAYPTRRETFHPARLRLEEDGYVVQPV